jgi:hypothetical protein
MVSSPGPFLGLLLALAVPSPVLAQAVPGPTAPAEAAGGPVSRRELAGHYFVPSHLVQDPFSVTSVGLFWGVSGGDATGPTLDVGPPPSVDFQNTRSYGFNGLGLGMLLEARILEWFSIHGQADASAYLGTGNRSILILGTSAQLTGMLGVKGSVRVGEHVRLAALLDAQYGPIFTALIAPGLIQAITSGRIDLDQFLAQNQALTWIPALAGSYAPWPFLGVTLNFRLLFPDGSGNAQFASSGMTFAAMVDLDLRPLVPFVPIGVSGVYSILSPLGGALATTQDFGLGLYYTGVPTLAAGIEIDWRLGRLASQHVAGSTAAWMNLRYYWDGA